MSPKARILLNVAAADRPMLNSEVWWKRLKRSLVVVMTIKWGGASGQGFLVSYRGWGVAAPYSEVQCIMGNSHMWTPHMDTHPYENITFLHLLADGKMSRKYYLIKLDQAYYTYVRNQAHS